MGSIQTIVCSFGQQKVLLVLKKIGKLIIACQGIGLGSGEGLAST
jgi:hypothetical protein